MDLILLTLSTLLFLVGFAFSVTTLRSGAYHKGRTNVTVIGLGFLLQSVFLSIRGKLHARCPITDGTEILVFIAWSLAIMYFILGRAFRLSLVGAFTAPILAMMQLLALVLTLINPVEARPKEIEPWLEMHAAMSLLAYGAFALASIAAVMFLVQNRQLKSGQPGNLSFNLPPIRYLGNALIRLLGIGLLLLTIGIIAAFFRESAGDRLHLILAGGVWAVYLGILIFYWVRRPAPKWLSIASLIAFGFALVTLSLT